MTIIEIAEMVGVSIGTVDRVIHKRGRVSPETARKIEAVITQSGYRPNPLARHLKLGREYHVGVLLPSLHSEDGYWQYVFDGICKAEEELQPFSIQVELVQFDRTTAGSFLNEGRQLAGKIDALIVAPVVPEECCALLHELEGIPYAFIDSALPDLNPVAVFAQNPFRGGFTAGRMMRLLAPFAKKFASFQLHSSAFNSRERSRGFMAFFAGVPQTSVMEITYTSEHTEEGLFLFWDDFFAIYSDIDGIFVVNDAVHRLGVYLKKRGFKEKIALVGYDLIEPNKKGLLDGSIDCIISQQPEFQGYTALYELYRKVVLHQQIETAQVPIDIYFKENLL